MVIAGIYGTVFVVLGIAIALWSLWTIVRAAQVNPAERAAEDEARERVARGEGWEDAAGHVPFSDDELAALSDALRPQTPEEAGVDTRPRPDEPKGPFNRR